MASSIPAAACTRRSLSIIIRADDDHCYSDWENPKQFSGFAKRMEVIMHQMIGLFHGLESREHVPVGVITSMKGIAAEFEKAVEVLEVFKCRSKIMVLIRCKEVCRLLQERTSQIAAWLALLGSAIDDAPELHKKIIYLSRDMKQAHFHWKIVKVTENEERVHQMLQEEGREARRKTSNKAVQSGIVMDMARVLGVEFSNYEELVNQVMLLRDDMSDNSAFDDTDWRILKSLEAILDRDNYNNWLFEPHNIEAEIMEFFNPEDARQMISLKNFLCPLTQEVMKEPVVLETGQTYERIAIQHWFQRCAEDGRKPICPVSGTVLNQISLKPNIGLAGAIEEWVSRCVDIKIKYIVQCLSDEDSASDDKVEQALDATCKILLEEDHHPVGSRCKIRKSGIVILVIGMLKNGANRYRSVVRSKALMVLFSMVKDDESKVFMLEEGISRLAIHSLTGSSDNEREYAVKLLLEFCNDETCCTNIAAEKGGLLLLSSMADSHENPSLTHLAVQVLKCMERIEGNIKELAEAGRFESLLKELHEGSDEVKAEMASILGSMTLTNTSKEQIARCSSKDLVELLSTISGREASLKALYNLSSLDDNASILVDSAVLPALTDILISQTNHQNNESSAEQIQLLKELSAAVIANIVANPGHWELAPADSEGNPMQSQVIVHNLLALLPRASPKCQLSILQILCGVASSPQASECVSTHIASSMGGLKIIVRFLKHPRVEHRSHAFRIIRMLSRRSPSEELASEIRAHHKIQCLKDKILDNQATEAERSDSACILANITLSDNEVKSVLGENFLRWIMTSLKDNEHHESMLTEGILGVLLHFLKSQDTEIASIVEQVNLMSVLCELLVSTSKTKVKQLAANGLECLSQLGNALFVAGMPGAHKSNKFCSSLKFIICGKASAAPANCPIHNFPCEEENQLCLLKSDCIKPLMDILKDKDTDVQVASIQALSTLLPHDTSTNVFKRVVDEIDRMSVIDGVISLFIEARPGEVQDKAIWMVERVLRSEGLSLRHSLNQPLVIALVEAFKHGGCGTTKKHAQGALTNLKQISGFGGKTATQTKGRKSE
ncbi:ubiquitin-protein ligase [Lithospermum erythrorhizon]|uniref:RING-type E3 ubiquitin transferase n=1 Tax=Lithospermum erythrorhizon TaxID=34254 RepID=A0AAV3PHX0_LITER